MPDPFKPRTEGATAVTAMLVGGPAGVPGGGGGVVPPPPPPPPPVPPPPPAATFCTVSCTVLPAEVQLALMKTVPATQRASTATLHEKVVLAVPSAASVAVVAASAPKAATKVTAPEPGVPAAVTALARIVTGTPSFRTEVADGRSVSEAVGPLPPLEPAQARRPASAADPRTRAEARRKVTDPPTRASARELCTRQH